VVMRALAACAADENRIVVIVTHDVESLPSDCRVLRLTDSGLRD
jgi:ABC-type lipoprotein export system ATPase subunit